jgi:hypothetical protein
MTGFQDVAPEQLAKLFFHYREALAPDFPGYPQNHGTNSYWETAHERDLLVATSRLVLMELASEARRQSQDGTADKNQLGNVRVRSSEGKECGC